LLENKLPQKLHWSNLIGKISAYNNSFGRYTSNRIFYLLEHEIIKDPSLQAKLEYYFKTKQ